MFYLIFIDKILSFFFQTLYENILITHNWLYFNRISTENFKCQYWLYNTLTVDELIDQNFLLDVYHCRDDYLTRDQKCYFLENNQSTDVQMLLMKHFPGRNSHVRLCSSNMDEILVFCWSDYICDVKTYLWLSIQNCTKIRFFDFIHEFKETQRNIFMHVIHIWNFWIYPNSYQVKIDTNI